MAGNSGQVCGRNPADTPSKLVSALPDKQGRRPPHLPKPVSAAWPWESVHSNSRLRRWLKHQAILGLLINSSPRVQHRKITHLVPERHQVGIMGATRLSAFSGSVRDDRFIPIPHIQNFAIAWAAQLVKFFTRVTRVVDGGGIAGTRQRPNVQERLGIGEKFEG